jgi:hypothetical protein
VVAVVQPIFQEQTEVMVVLVLLIKVMKAGILHKPQPLLQAVAVLDKAVEKQILLVLAVLEVLV